MTKHLKTMLETVSGDSAQIEVLKAQIRMLDNSMISVQTLNQELSLRIDELEMENDELKG